MSEIKATEIEMVSVNELIPHPKNMHEHPKDQIDRLCKIIEYQGFRTPLTVQKGTNLIVTGHGRLMAAKQLNMTHVPVSYQEFESEDMLYAHIVADNAIGKDTWASLDLSKINMELENLGPMDIDLLGIKDFVVEPIEKLDPLTDEDDVPEVSDPITKRGDIWMLGKHRLICGDSTQIETYEQLMGDNRADITFTSPPYNAGYNIRGNFYENDNDDKTSGDYLEFLKDFTNNCMMFSDYVFNNIQMLEGNKKTIIEYQYFYVDMVKDILIWNKSQYPPHVNNGTFGCKWEYVICLAESGKSRSFPCSWQGKYPNVIDTESNSRNKFVKTHKAGFPVSFPSWIIEKMDFAKSMIDPFMGTGTSLIACEKNEITSYGIELDGSYVDISVKRWQEYTGKDAILQSNGKTFNELSEDK